MQLRSKASDPSTSNSCLPRRTRKPDKSGRHVSLRVGLSRVYVHFVPSAPGLTDLETRHESEHQNCLGASSPPQRGEQRERSWLEAEGYGWNSGGYFRAESPQRVNSSGSTALRS
jgi:hypothetical protein